MKKLLFILGLVGSLSLTTVSCSNDDSVAPTDKSADGNLTPVDNGDRDLPKPPRKV